MEGFVDETEHEVAGNVVAEPFDCFDESWVEDIERLETVLGEDFELFVEGG